MSRPSTQASPPQTPGSDEQDIQRLRALILGADYETLFEFKRCLATPEKFQQRLSESVSEALSLRGKADNSIEQSLAPIMAPAVESALTESISKNPVPMADALYPVMGPAIRKSINEAMSQALANFNNVLEQSFSARSIKWRIDAMRTGKSYAEIALLKTLDYQVEQVFLIHRETSLLLRHVVAEQAIAKDADMVSSMLSAIQDFVSDSFSTTDGETLSTLQLGDLTVCISEGPKAVIASVVRGSLPDNLRLKMNETLEKIHQEHWHLLNNFEGDAEPLAGVEPQLQQCLLSRNIDDNGLAKKKKPWIAIIVIGLIVAALAYMKWTSYKATQLWSDTVGSISAEPGVVVVDAGKSGDRYYINGLRDPKARPLNELIDTKHPLHNKIDWRMQAFYSVDSSIVEQRVAEQISFPDSVKYHLNDTELVLSGEASKEWIASVSTSAKQVVGVDTLATALLSETAPDIVDNSTKIIAQLINDIESTVLYFASGKTELEPASYQSIPLLSKQLSDLKRKSAEHGHYVQLYAIGYSDPSGSAEANLRISQIRADNVLRALNATSNDSVQMHAVSKGSEPDPLRKDDDNDRHVRLKINLTTDDSLTPNKLAGQ